MSGERTATAPRQQRKTETRERLLRAATELFAAQGFEETTYDEIAQAAAVARQTVFNHFPRKEDFVLAWGALRREEITHALADRAFTEKSATARLVLIMQVLAESYERSPAAGRVYTLAWVKWGGPVLEERTLATQFAGVIEEGQRSGEIRDDVSAQTAGELIRAAYFDALWRWAAPDRPADAPSLFADLLIRLELILTGLCVLPDREGLKRSMRLAQAIEVTRRPEGPPNLPS
ncbi:TetR/AcrR family transcriptional regulator [Streptomyces sp. AF1A]|jgi:AcrR family transcriptional regulator|uniref:TetR/AcrR family transcriptional regulator n=1 Tax=Streptomyces sp. AF1A TaxID=3394350 RepID=UPI0039BC7BAD